MVTKTTKALELFSSGDMAGALRIFKTFRIGLTADERRILQIAQESLTGKESFYQSLQLNTEAIKQEAIQIIKQKYSL